MDEIVREANRIFLEDQYEQDGDATLCCARDPDKTPTNSPESKSAGSDNEENESVCGGPSGICKHFYDSAPSGHYGSMCYIFRACCNKLEALPNEGIVECPVS